MTELEKIFNAQQSNMISSCFVTNSLSTTILSYKMAEALCQKGKPYVDGDIIKECLRIFVSALTKTMKVKKLAFLIKLFQERSGN